MLINLALLSAAGVGFAAGTCWHWSKRDDLARERDVALVKADRYRTAFELADIRVRELVSANRELSTQLALAVSHPSRRIPESAEVIQFRQRHGGAR